MGLRAVTLGYANERVNRAAIREIERGVNLTRASTVELAAAELIVELLPSADMVKFAKNGSNVTTAAVKVARAYTGRKYVCVPRQHPFFSFDDWFIGATPITRGVPEGRADYTLMFDYGDIQSLTVLFEQHGTDIACVMLEPATNVFPCPMTCTPERDIARTCAGCPNRTSNFLHQVRELAHRHGALFVLDEMITGFRWHLQGAQTYFGVEPDLATFGKGMANGFSVAALTGKREFMKVGSINEAGAERVFLVSTTHGGEMPGLGAFIEAVNVYRDEGVIAHLWQYGQALFEGVNRISRTLGLEPYFAMEGSYISMGYVARDRNGAVSAPFRTLFAQEMIRNGVLMPWVAVSLAHGPDELARTLAAVESALSTYRRALEGRIEDYLVGPAVKPVFRRFN
jgi:glutamate-1-semialdehyde 2,1-aminomutase